MTYGGYDDRRGGYGGSRGGGGGRSSFGNNLRTIDWNRVELIKFEKDFYQQHPAVAAMTEREGEEVRQWKQISIISGSNCPKPVRTFEEASFPEYVLEEIRYA